MKAKIILQSEDQQLIRFIYLDTCMYTSTIFKKEWKKFKSYAAHLCHISHLCRQASEFMEKNLHDNDDTAYQQHHYHYYYHDLPQFIILLVSSYTYILHLLFLIHHRTNLLYYWISASIFSIILCKNERFFATCKNYYSYVSSVLFHDNLLKNLFFKY